MFNQRGLGKGYSLVALKRLQAIGKQIDLDILTTGRALAIVGKEQNREHIFESAVSDDAALAGASADSAPSAPRVQAAALIEALVLSEWALVRDYLSDPKVDWVTGVRKLEDDIRYVQGYLDAMLYARDEHVRRGARGRRLIGATSRAKVRQAVIAMGARTSKEQAAPLIALAVGKSSATVRKLLTEMYPGSAWDELSNTISADAHSTDTGSGR